MNEKYNLVDMKNWKRSLHCRVFRNHALPLYGMTVDMDITNFYQWLKETNRPFFLSFAHIVTACANEIEEFRYRFVEGKVALFKQINTALTHMDTETELFKVVKVEMKEDLDEYTRVAAAAIKNQQEYFTGPLGQDVFLLSAIPWITYTQISQVHTGDQDDASPVFEWGKFYERHSKKMMPFSLQVHHSFVDGVHISRLVERVQERMDQLTIDN